VIQISGPGLKTETSTQSNGRFVFDKLPAGRYTITPFLPNWLVHRGASAVTVAVNGSDSVRADFYVARREQVTPTPTITPENTPTPSSTNTPTATETPSATNTPSPEQAVEEERRVSGARQPAAAAPPPPPRPLVTSLQGLRFAPGRSSPSMVQAVRTDRSLWLGVPFTTQIDGTLYAEVNCGPASVAMVLGAFGVKAAPAYLRDYVNYLSGTFSPDEGTSLYHLARVVREAGLEVRRLQGQGGYFRWNIPTLRQEIEEGRPVVTLVKYRALPGHESSTVDWDHYIVITGLSGGDFIYNDAAFATERGYGLLISPGDLERAWDYSTLPRHGMAVGLAGGVLPQLPPAPPGVRRPAGEQGEVEIVPPTAAMRDGWASDEPSDEQEGGEAADEAEFDPLTAFGTLSFSRLALEQPPEPDPSNEAGRPLHLPSAPPPVRQSVAPEIEASSLGELDEALLWEPELVPAETRSTAARYGLEPSDPFLWLLLLISVAVVRLTRGRLVASAQPRRASPAHGSFLRPMTGRRAGQLRVVRRAGLRQPEPLRDPPTGPGLGLE
jgi:hypothetical protein